MWDRRVVAHEGLEDGVRFLCPRHPVIGDVRLMAPPFVLSDADQGPVRAGPTLGQHTEEVFRGIVGLDAAQYAAFEAAGVFK